MLAFKVAPDSFFLEQRCELGLASHDPKSRPRIPFGDQVFALDETTRRLGGRVDGDLKLVHRINEANIAFGVVGEVMEKTTVVVDLVLGVRLGGNNCGQGFAASVDHLGINGANKGEQGHVR